MPNGTEGSASESLAGMETFSFTGESGESISNEYFLFNLELDPFGRIPLS